MVQQEQSLSITEVNSLRSLKRMAQYVSIYKHVFGYFQGSGQMVYSIKLLILAAKGGLFKAIKHRGISQALTDVSIPCWNNLSPFSHVKPWSGGCHRPINELK